MTPCLPCLNIRNGRSVNTILISECLLRHLATFGPDRQHVGFGEFSSPVSLAAGHQARDAGVTAVLGGCHPFQVCESIVSLDSVDMVALVTGRARPQECLGNQTMNVVLGRMVVGSEHNGLIKASTRRKNPANLSVRYSPYSTHLSEVADFVESFKSNDRSPFFGGFCDKLRLHREAPFSVSRSRTALTVAAASIIPQIGGA